MHLDPQTEVDGAGVNEERRHREIGTSERQK